jgi:hypothetical protein
LTDSSYAGPEAVDALPALAFVFSSVFKEPKLSARTATVREADGSALVPYLVRAGHRS